MPTPFCALIRSAYEIGKFVVTLALGSADFHMLMTNLWAARMFG